MQNNFSYPLKLEDISSASKQYSFTASEDELVFVASILKVPSVKSFQSVINITLNKPEHLINLTGCLDAMIEQTSVISLENFIRPYHSEFTRTYDTKLTYAQQREMEEFEDINADIPDVMENGIIDLKAVALEALALELDDFPKQPGELFSFTPDFDINTDKPQNPFAILEKLKK